MTSEVSNELLKEIRDKFVKDNPEKKIRAWMIKDYLKSEKKIDLDESTVRGRFIEMGEPLSGASMGSSKTKKVESESKTKRANMQETALYRKFTVSDEMMKYIPDVSEFENYIERDIDTRLAIHYNLVKYPITQGKQGTGKTFSHMYYAFKNGLPLFLFSCYEDFRLTKLFGDKTIKNGSIVFQESLFVKAIQGPSVILFDEINAVSNANTFDFHALLQNRELYIKDANDGEGKIFVLHPECRIGFAQNPKSAK